MSFESNKRFTYANLKLMNIKRMMLNSNPIMKTPSNLDVVNVALEVLELVCMAHNNNESNMHMIVEDMIDDEDMFNEYVQDFIYKGQEQNKSLNEYLDKQIDLKRNEVKK